MMNVIYLDEDHCPECGTLLTATAPIDGRDISPQAHDISICFECTSYLKYDENVKLQKMTVEDIVELTNEELLSLTNERKNIKAFKKWRELQNSE